MAAQPKSCRRPPTRYAAVLRQPDAHSAGLLRITVDGTATLYDLLLLSVDWDSASLAVRLVNRSNHEVYDVLVQPDSAPECDCRGHQRWHHCKHADAVSALLKAGKLEV